MLGDGHIQRSEKTIPKITPSLIQLEQALNILNPLSNAILYEKDLLTKVTVFNNAVATFSASKATFFMLHKQYFRMLDTNLSKSPP